MTLRMEIVNPLDQPGWGDLLMTHKESTFFHTAAWAKVLHESYGYDPTYITIMDGPDLLALIPLMDVRSFLTGRRGVSLPFTDCCDPLITKGVLFGEIIDDLIEYGKQAKWNYLELRTAHPLPAEIPASAIFHGHTLDITGSEDAIFSALRDSTRRNIKKSEKEGVVVTISGSADSLREFYRLNCMTRRDHGLPCQPYVFFENIYSHIIARNLGIVVLAAIEGKKIAGAVFFHFGSRAIYKFGASDRNYLQLRSNNLVFWKAIQWYCGHGFKRLDFGRTESENTGLLQFKRGWGASEYQINYCKYDFRQRAYVSDHLKVTGWHNSIFRRMPVPLLRIAGSMLYRHVG
jgi:CelD/BcsL family acetyltransferase involved in cellulose biosynthesis